MSRSQAWEDYLDEELQDPEVAADLLSASLEDDEPEVFLLALRHVARARSGGLARLASDTRLNREHLYRMLSPQGNPGLRSLGALLDTLGLQLTVRCKEAS